MTNYFVKDKETFNLGGIKITGTLYPLENWVLINKGYIRLVIHRIQYVISLNMKDQKQSSQAIRSSSPAADVSSRSIPPFHLPTSNRGIET
jgi:hypothetical protein